MTDYERLVNAIEMGKHCWFSSHELWYSAYKMLTDIGYKPTTIGARCLLYGSDSPYGRSDNTIVLIDDTILACSYSLCFIEDGFGKHNVEKFYDESFLYLATGVDIKGLFDAVFEEVTT